MSPNTEYSVGLAFAWTLPLLILNSSTKFWSAVEPNVNLESVKVMFNLWAPFAFSFDEPVALSKSEVSDSGVIKFSVIVKPTLYDGVFEYLSKISLCDVLLTKCPRIK